MSTIACPGYKNFSYEQGDLPPVRIALINDCPLISTLVLNSIISSLKRPYVLSFHKTYGTIVDGKWTGMYKDLIDNRSDICANYNSITYEKFRSMYSSRILDYSNTISILSGKIYANTGNSFSLFSSFSTDLWIIFVLSLIIVSMINTLLHLLSDTTSLISLLIQVFENLFNLVIYFFSQSLRNFFQNLLYKTFITKFNDNSHNIFVNEFLYVEYSIYSSTQSSIENRFIRRSW